MDRDRIVKAIEGNMPWHESRYFRKGDVRSILEAAGYFEIVEAAKDLSDAIDSQKNAEMSIKARMKHGVLKVGLRKAGVFNGNTD